jgi:predicted ATPase/DNA-binding CsgD family transcriptional regulator
MVGRERDVEAVDALVRAHELVSVVGGAGIGKTTLSRHVADRAGSRGHAICWVDLSPLAPGDRVDDVLLAAVRGVLPGGAAADVTTLERALRTLGPTLLVLDNCEHVAAQTAHLAEQLLDCCPDTRVLATTRIALGLPSETTWRLGALVCPPKGTTSLMHLGGHPAAVLFVARARRCGREMNDGDAAAIAAICHLLDGNPLALIIAASRAGALAIPDLAESLAASNAVLVTTHDEIAGRHRDVLHSIRWSCELLSADTRAALHAVAAFPDRFTLAAASTVLAQIAPAADPAAALAKLVDVGLVEFDGSSKYRLTFVVRHYVRDVDADRDLLDVAAALHARATIENLIDANRWGASIDPELVTAAAPDVRAALAWAARHDADLAYRGIVGFGVMLSAAAQYELCEWLSSQSERSVDWALAVGWLSILAPAAARPILTSLFPEAVAIGDAADDGHIARVLRCTPVYVHCLLGDLGPALDLAGDARDAEDGWVTLAVASIGSLVAARLGNGRLAATLAAHTAWACAQGRLPYLMTASAVADAVVLHHRAELADARACLDAVIAQQSVRAAVLEARLDLAIDRDDIDAVRSVADALADTDDLLGRFTYARARWWLTIGDGATTNAASGTEPPGVPWAIDLHLARAATLAGTPDEAEPVLADAENALRSLSTDAPLLAARLSILRARVDLARGRVAEAEAALLGAIDLARTNRLELALCDALGVASQLAAARSNARLAARLAGATEAFRERTGYHSRLFAGRFVVADVVPAFAEGSTLDLHRAAALARRARGQRRRPAFGIESLTPTERMVGDLVAAGHTNAEIASGMLISEATVKTHLTRAYAKLGVGNRTQLALRVRDAGRSDGVVDEAGG